MSTRKEPKYKVDRQLSANLWGRPKSPYNKRAPRPGEHGQKNRKPSNYALQLSAKQKLKNIMDMLLKGNLRNIIRRLLQEKGIQVRF